MQMFVKPNYFISTFLPASNLKDFKTVTCGDLLIRIGQNAEGSLVVQSFLFPKSKFSLAEATILAHQLEKILK